MARRSPMNERYQKNTAPSGKTRKSAASAKPKRGGSAPAAKSPAKKARPAPVLVNPPTPEFKRLRKIWWVLLITSAVITFGSWGARAYLHSELLANIALGVGYAFIGGALWLDMTKIRKMRNDYIAEQKSGKPSQKASTPKAAAKSETANESSSDNTTAEHSSEG
ncbi:MAG TPA: hypothetical protein VFG89_02805 [Coriobacteriia bacterium]|nr:hypothetical protein [Coriobacteriia bacterium]